MLTGGKRKVIEMKLNQDLFVKELGSFVMGLKEAQDLFSEVGTLSIGEMITGPVLMLKDKVHGWNTYFWKGGIEKWTFCPKDIANYVAEELGFEPSNTVGIEVTAWLVGKESVMVRIYETNTRPASFTEASPIVDALEMGFELGCDIDNEKFHLHFNGLKRYYLREGDEIKGEYKNNFLHGLYNPYHWKVVIEQILVDKVICRCMHVADYRIGH